MNLRRRATVGALWGLIESSGAQLSSFILFLIFARLIDARAIGMVQIAMVLIAFLALFVENGFTTAVIQRAKLTATTLNTTFWLSVGGGLVVAAALAACAPWVADAYGTPELTPLIQVLAWYLPVATLGTIQSALLIRDLAFRTQALRRLAAVFVGGVLGVIMAFNGFGVWALVARTGCEAVVASLIAWLWVPWRPGLTISRQDAREVVGFASSIVGTSAIALFTRRIDELIVGLFLGPAVLGYFAVATRAVLLVREVALRGLSRTALPVFSRLRESPERMKTAFYDAVEFGVTLAGPVFVGLSAVAEELCLTLFGAKWEPAIPAMSILGYGGIATVVSVFTSSLLVACGKANWLFYFSIAEAVLTLGTSLIAVHWGLSAVAIAYVLRSFATLPLGLHLARRSAGISPGRVFAGVVWPVIATLAMAGVVSALRFLCESWSPPVRLAFLSLAGALIYVSLLTLLARSTVKRLVALARDAMARKPVA